MCCSDGWVGGNQKGPSILVSFLYNNQGSANHMTRMSLAAIILLCDYFDSHDSHILANHANL